MAIRIKDFSSVIPSEYRELFDGAGVPDGLQYALVKGRRLSALLNRLIDDQVNEETSRADVIQNMARAAGISAGTVNEILNGDIDCPPLRRLSGFASALESTLDRLRSAAESDGCEYGRESSACPSKAEAHKSRSVRFVASDDSVDLDDEIIVGGAFQRRIGSFASNPVLLAGHRHTTSTGASSVIGSVKELDASSSPMTARAVFGDNAAGEDHWRLYRDGHQRAFSVGFRVLKTESKSGRTHIVDALLLEISAVAVPANPNALVMDFVAGRLAGFAEQRSRQDAGHRELDELRHAIDEMTREVGKHGRILGTQPDREKDFDDQSGGGDTDGDDAEFIEMVNSIGNELAASAPS